MASTIIVCYDTRVWVEVNVTTGAVEKVSVGDETAELDRDGTYLMQDVDPLPGKPDPLIEKAIEIAESEEWPAWDFGL